MTIDSHSHPPPTRAGDPAPSVEILLATHNSARFLGELLDSLFAQTCQRFTLLVADDGSSDATLRILDRYSERYPGRIRIVAEAKSAQGPMPTFSRLLEEARADYAMLCDHDDVWLSHKVEASVRRIAEIEAERGPQVPVLVHSDLAVVGPALEPISPSFFQYTGMDPQRHEFERLLMSNVATGCATILNRALYERARPVPAEAMMHDWWLALVASCFGTCNFLDDATVLYRQHGANVIGARGRTDSVAKRIWRTLFSDRSYRVLRSKSRQAAALLARYRCEMDADDVRKAETLANVWSAPRHRRLAHFRQSVFPPTGLSGKVALFLALVRR